MHILRPIPSCVRLPLSRILMWFLVSKVEDVVECFGSVHHSELMTVTETLIFMVHLFAHKRPDLFTAVNEFMKMTSAMHHELWGIRFLWIILIIGISACAEVLHRELQSLYSTSHSTERYKDWWVLVTFFSLSFLKSKLQERRPKECFWQCVCL